MVRNWSEGYAHIKEEKRKKYFRTQLEMFLNKDLPKEVLLEKLTKLGTTLIEEAYQQGQRDRENALWL